MFLFLSLYLMSSPMNAWSQIDVAKLVSSDFSASELQAVIASTASGRDLFQQFQVNKLPLPSIIPMDELSADQVTLLCESGASIEDILAMYVPEGLIENQAAVVVYRRAPLFATAYLVSHELQHLLDQRLHWWSLIYIEQLALYEKVRPAQASGRFRLEDLEAIELIQGLKGVRTYLTEYQAFSRGYQIRRELEGSYPFLSEKWIQFKTENKVTLDLNPSERVEERTELYRAYIWQGNTKRFSNAVSHIRRNKKLLQDLADTGVQFPWYSVPFFSGATSSGR